METKKSWGTVPVIALNRFLSFGFLSRKKGKEGQRMAGSEESGSSTSGSDSGEEDRRRRDKKRKRDKKKDKKKSKKKSKKRKKEKAEKNHKRKRQKVEAEEGEEHKTSLYQQKLEDDRKSRELVSMLGYTNDDNPYGDPNLTQKFEWGKKGNKGAQKERRFDERVKELGDVRKRREEREEFREAQAQKRAEEARQRESEMYGDLEAKEGIEEKLVDKHRSRLRLRRLHGDGAKSKLVDEMYRNVLLLEEKNDTEGRLVQKSLRIGDRIEPTLTPPTKLLEATKDLKKLEEALFTIQGFIQHDLDVGFWTPVAECIAAKIEKGQWLQQDPENAETAVQVSNLLEGKTVKELTAMRQDVLNNCLGSASAGDEPYWRCVLSDISTRLGGEKIKDAHAECLKQLGVIERKEDFERKLRETERDIEAKRLEQEESARSLAAKEAQVEIRRLTDQDLGITALGSMESQIQGIRTVSSLEDKIWRKRLWHMVAEREQEKNIELLYTKDPVKALEQLSKRRSKASADDQAEQDAASDEDKDAGEATPVVEVQVPRVAKTWQNRYRPQKPKFFSKIKVGFDWNKYNKTHYDKDNPPPKIVTGYEFEIDYPNLLDKTKAPTYSIGPDESPEFAVLTFHAGPPYLDIAFKIVNREWQKGKFSGFKYIFSGKKLILKFKLKRFGYRR